MFSKGHDVMPEWCGTMSCVARALTRVVVQLYRQQLLYYGIDTETGRAVGKREGMAYPEQLTPEILETLFKSVKGRDLHHTIAIPILGNRPYRDHTT